MSTTLVTLKFTHISDLHIRHLDSFSKITSDPDVQRKLVKANEILREKIIHSVQGFGPEFVLCTGDIADGSTWNLKTEDKKPDLKRINEVIDTAKKFFSNLTKNNEQLFFTPGNHDLIRDYRDKLLPLEFLQSREHEASIQEVNYYIDQIFDAHKGPGKGQFERYLQIVKTQEEEEYLGGIYKFLPLQGKKVAIVNLNNSWFCHQEDMNRLYIGERRGLEILEKLEDSKPDLVLGMMHHPEDYINYRERIIVKDQENKVDYSGVYQKVKEKCDAIFSGHTHLQTLPDRTSSSLRTDTSALEFYSGGLHFNPSMFCLRAIGFNYKVDFSNDEKPRISRSPIGQHSLFLDEYEFETEDLLSINYSRKEENNRVSRELLTRKAKYFHMTEPPKPLEEDTFLFNEVLTCFYKEVKESILDETGQLPFEKLDTGYYTMKLDQVDFLQRRTCLIEKYYTEFYAPEPKSTTTLMTNISVLHNVSGTDFFAKVICLLFEEKLIPGISLISANNKTSIDLDIEIEAPSNLDDHERIFFKEQRMRIADPLRSDGFIQKMKTLKAININLFYS